MSWSAQWLRAGDREMERESLLTLLILLLGGLMLMLVALLQQLHAWGRARQRSDTRAQAGADAAERAAWRALAAPVNPALLVASALCGWALAEPDPVPQR